LDTIRVSAMAFLSPHIVLVICDAHVSCCNMACIWCAATTNYCVSLSPGQFRLMDVVAR
jgi:hypothetical protein